MSRLSRISELPVDRTDPVSGRILTDAALDVLRAIMPVITIPDNYEQLLEEELIHEEELLQLYPHLRRQPETTEPAKLDPELTKVLVAPANSKTYEAQNTGAAGDRQLPPYFRPAPGIWIQ